ncbi:MAG: alpha-galactosidase [Thermotogaceae bacterium]|jgi:alpha-galactosidase|nr:alpha-galactosidase [Thermotogaceae bacterium]
MKRTVYKKSINDNNYLKIEIEGENIFCHFKEEDFGKYKIIRFTMSPGSEEKVVLNNLIVTVRTPIIDIHGISIPGKVNNPYLYILPWYVEEYINLYKEFPFVSLINRKGENKFSIGIKDPRLGFKLSGKIFEKSEEFEMNISSVSSIVSKSLDFEIFISDYPDTWFEITGEYSNWANSQQDRLPDWMYDPVYCSWYAFYQEVNQDHLEHVAQEAYNLGFKIFILDDGWFTFDNNRGYWYTGDWEVYKGKFPNFKKHVENVQKIGMKYVLWVAPFMFGKKSKNYELLSKYSVKTRDNLGFEDLCPQSNFTKYRIVNVLSKLLTKYNLDGFKLDFIDDLPVEPCLNDFHEHFTDNPSHGVESILKEIKQKLEEASNKQLILEFRQQYANPLLKDYSTAFRAADTPFDFDQNRRRIINIRSFSGSFPVYSDPIVWKKGESTENISRHFISCIFSVPMLSVDLLKLDEREKKVIKFWTDFFMKNRETLLFGKFVPEFSCGDFTQAFAFSQYEKKLIIALYTKNVLSFENLKEFLSDTSEMYILNGSNNRELIILDDSINKRTIDLEIFDPVVGLKSKLKQEFSKFLKIDLGIGNILKITL